MPYLQTLAYLALSLVFALVACVSKHKSPPLEFQGTVSYRERVAVEPGSVVEVELVDASRSDAPAVVLARREIAMHTQVPVPFALPVDRDRLVPGGVYLLQARIKTGERVLFETVDAVRATPASASGNEIVLRPSG